MGLQAFASTALPDIAKTCWKSISVLLFPPWCSSRSAGTPTSEFEEVFAVVACLKPPRWPAVPQVWLCEQGFNPQPRVRSQSLTFSERYRKLLYDFTLQMSHANRSSRRQSR